MFITTLIFILIILFLIQTIFELKQNTDISEISLLETLEDDDENNISNNKVLFDIQDKLNILLNNSQNNNTNTLINENNIKIKNVLDVLIKIQANTLITKMNSSVENIEIDIKKIVSALQNIDKNYKNLLPIINEKINISPNTNKISSKPVELENSKEIQKLIKSNVKLKDKKILIADKKEEIIANNIDKKEEIIANNIDKKEEKEIKEPIIKEQNINIEPVVEEIITKEQNIEETLKVVGEVENISADIDETTFSNIKTIVEEQQVNKIDILDNFINKNVQTPIENKQNINSETIKNRINELKDKLKIQNPETNE